MALLRMAVMGLAVALAPTEATSRPPPAPTTVAEFTEFYAEMQLKACIKIVESVPPLPAASQAAFMAAYQAYVGTDPTKVIAAATKVLTDAGLAAFLAPAAESFGPGGLDETLVQCALLTDATPLVLAEFVVLGKAQHSAVSDLLRNGPLMRDMLVGGGPRNGKYGEAAYYYSLILKASDVLQGAPAPAGDVGVWDDRNNKTTLHRAALATALACGDNITMGFRSEQIEAGRPSVDPLSRYLSFEKAYLAGDLDPYFEVLTTFEMRFAVAHPGVDADMEWFRETLANVNPVHIVGFEYDYNWRYARAVRTDVAYGDSVFPDGRANGRYRDIPAAGGVCGMRAFFGRFSRRSFGLPTLPLPEPGHGAMLTWGPGGWVSLLGRNLEYGNTIGNHGTRSGPDFKLETDSREFREEYQRVLRGSWAAAALGETPVSAGWTPHNPKSFGIGGNWSALMFGAKLNATSAPFPPRALNVSVVPTKTDALIARWNVSEPAANVTVGVDGSITIPATAVAWMNSSAQINITKSGDSGSQLMHLAGSFLDANSTAFEYVIDSEEGGAYYLTTNFTTWHVNTDLQLTVNHSMVPLEIPLFYTGGYWKETQPVEVTLVKGLNILRFTRKLGAGIVIKQFFLLKTKPILPLPPGNYTPAPAPPPIDKYIKLAAGLSCVSQGILDLSDSECGYAAATFGFKYTGSRSRPTDFGCWGLLSGPYAGNSNLNTNVSATVRTKDTAALCLR